MTTFLLSYITKNNPADWAVGLTDIVIASVLASRFLWGCCPGVELWSQVDLAA
ncbi:hypothetical protein [Arthrobacter sp. NPDC093139]|uniref:hypothetical protein n=1 Tax=Arthrobacter sp. NPDC093139 TaxID=3363945 RepID=UPI0038287F22